MSYSVNWNNVALQAVTAGLDEVPVLGGLLSHLVEAFWPESQEDVWSEVKDKVEALIGQAISSDDYDRVQTQLGTNGQDSGLIGVLNSYLGAVSTTDNNGQNPEETWTSANEVFIGAQSAFQQNGIEVLLLPLFAQFANMHLSLLRDGVINKWCAVSELQKRIKDYGAWADKYVAAGHSARSGENKGFNYLNVYDREMQTGVLNFRETWPYFDPTAFPPPVKDIVFTNEVYYTITETMGAAYPGGNYALPITPAGVISDIGVFWMQDLEDNYNLVQGMQITYTTEEQPYSGILVDGELPPINRTCDPNNDYYCYARQTVAVSPATPIVSVQGVFDAGGGTYCVDFTFKDGSSTGNIPEQAGQDYPHAFTLTPPPGYYLTSIFVPPSDATWYNAAPDVVFGFKLNPVNI